MIQTNNYSTMDAPTYEKWYSMSEAAKIINAKGIGRNKLYKFLKDKGILRGNNEPYQRFIDQGLLKYVVKDVENPYGKTLSFEPVTLVSLKGIEFIEQLLTNNQSNYATS